jgi:hypothetical protein
MGSLYHKISQNHRLAGREMQRNIADQTGQTGDRQRNIADQNRQRNIAVIIDTAERTR